MKENDNIDSSTECVAGKLDEISDSDDSYESSKEDESDTLSDIDDFEVDSYLHGKEESRLKKVIWEHLNRGYVQEQAAKEAAAAAARKLYTGNSEEVREARARAAAQAVTSKKEKEKRKRKLEVKNAKPAETAAGQQLKKRLSSKINYDVLNDLFGDEEPSPRVDDVSKVKGKEITNEDDEIDDDEWKYDDEQEMSGYVDYDQEY
ncbi:hypothetical protein SSX86_005361 [Deinandra increscens subsp. villosa]|uniref:Brf1 TBP-binding domain-containing protein n=1 Tax=Deinandra increscens subsp. villosa TaxID=3103831 RepID=A0AAP0H9R1_9ASTR